MEPFVPSPIPPRRGLYCVPTTKLSFRFSPSQVLHEREVRPMRMTNAALIEDALACSRSANAKTLASYRGLLRHYDEFLASACSVSMLEATHSHVDRFLVHLGAEGGSKPDPRRAVCDWCKAHGFPDGRQGAGWSPSRQKAYLAAIRLLYKHCVRQPHLPSTDPTAAVEPPRVKLKRQWYPSEAEVQRFLDAPGQPRDRLLAHWVYFAPARREMFARARWGDFTGWDTGELVWHVVDKGDKPHQFTLHPQLRTELLRYREWQLAESERNPAVRDALNFDDTAYVLLSRNGKRLAGQSIAKLIKWRAVRAGVGVVDASPDRKDCPGGKTSKLTPHALRRAWASHALNRRDANGSPVITLEVVQGVLNHSDISTTRRHYAFTAEDRVRTALLTHSLAA